MEKKFNIEALDVIVLTRGCREEMTKRGEVTIPDTGEAYLEINLCPDGKFYIPGLADAIRKPQKRA